MSRNEGWSCCTKVAGGMLGAAAVGGVGYLAFAKRKGLPPFNSSVGMAQSPVDLVSAETETDASLGDGAFKLAYEPSDLVTLNHTGTGWRVDCKPDAKSYLTAAHLPGTFRLVQFHIHWGTGPRDGSEHLVNGAAVAAELHLVHQNTKYGSLEEALGQPDGLAVLGIFLEEVAEENPAWAHFNRDLAKLTKAGDSVPITPGLDFDDLIPANKEFWTYQGGLTTAPYSECVVWTVFRHPTTISTGQLAFSRAITKRCVRDPQPLNGRKIRANFKD